MRMPNASGMVAASNTAVSVGLHRFSIRLARPAPGRGTLRPYSEPLPRGTFGRMTRARATRWLAWIVGGIFIAMGVIEVTVRLVSDEPIDLAAMAWWSLSLLGGGALVLLGSFLIKPSWVGFAAVCVGCLVGILATAWTLLIPVLAIALLILSAIQFGVREVSSTA